MLSKCDCLGTLCHSLRLHTLTQRRDLSPRSVYQLFVDTRPFSGCYYFAVCNDYWAAQSLSGTLFNSETNASLVPHLVTVCLEPRAHSFCSFKKIQLRWIEESELSAYLNMNVNVSLSVLVLCRSSDLFRVFSCLLSQCMLG